MSITRGLDKDSRANVSSNGEAHHSQFVNLLVLSIVCNVGSCLVAAQCKRVLIGAQIRARSRRRFEERMGPNSCQ